MLVTLLRASVFAAALWHGPSASAGEIERQAARLPEVDAPPRGQAMWIARAMRMNGLPMTIKGFTTSLKLDDVFHFYESWWRGRGFATLQREVHGEWQLFSINTGPHHITIEARPTREGSEGTITVSADPANVRPSTTRFPHPASASVASLQEYDDAGIEAEHIDFVSQRSLTAEVAEFRGLLRSTGWQLVLDEPIADGSGHVIEAQHGADLARVVLQPGRSVGAVTSIIAIWRKS
jgi:hypothetical protein